MGKAAGPRVQSTASRTGGNGSLCFRRLRLAQGQQLLRPDPLATPLLPTRVTCHPRPSLFFFKLSFRKSDLNIRGGRPTQSNLIPKLFPPCLFHVRFPTAGAPPALAGRGFQPYWLICVWTFRCRSVKAAFTKINSKIQNNLLKSFAASF